MITFKEYLTEVYNFSKEQKYWIGPDGEMFNVRHTCHEEWALENIFNSDEIDEFYQRFPEYGTEDHLDSEDGRGFIWDKSYELGWVDIHVENNEIYVRKPWDEIGYKVKASLKDFAIENRLNIVQYHWDKPRIIFSGKE